MKYLSQIFGMLVMGAWGFVLYGAYNFGMADCPWLYTAGILIHSFIVMLILYSVYHQYTFARSCCWHCLSGEHDTCRRSEDARIESKLYKHH